MVASKAATAFISASYTPPLCTCPNLFGAGVPLAGTGPFAPGLSAGVTVAPRGEACPVAAGAAGAAALGREAIKDFQPMQPGDVVATAADTSALERWVGFKPSTSIETGVDAFARWYRDHFEV